MVTASTDMFLDKLALAHVKNHSKLVKHKNVHLRLKPKLRSNI